MTSSKKKIINIPIQILIQFTEIIAMALFFCDLLRELFCIGNQNPDIFLSINSNFDQEIISDMPKIYVELKFPIQTNNKFDQ